MKNNFQSKSVPRGTRTIWRYLCALFLLFTFAIGNVWAACPDTGTIYKFATKSTLTGNTNITDNPVSITTSNYLESFVGSTGASLTAYNDNKKFQIASNGMKLADKSKARLILNLGECTLKKGDIVKIKVTSQNSVLSTSTSADDKFLSISKNANEQTLILEADVNASVVYLLATSNGAIVYSLEIIRPYNITLNANGGNVNGENSVEYGMMEAGILPRAEKESMRFVGWYDDPTAGTLKAGAFSKYTPTGNVTLYAHYADDCASSGEIYSFSINPKPAADIKAAAAAGSVVELVDYADCDGKGTASIGNNSTNQYVYVKSSDGKVYLTGNNSYLKLELACPLEEGDEITFVKSQALKISYTYNAASGTTSSLTSGTNTFTIPAESGWIGKRAIYCFYNSNGVNITSVSITRPAPVSTHTLTWDFDGGSTTSTTHTAAGQVAEGATITYPANNTMSKDSYDFAGWSTSATTMPNTDLTIVAQWTEHVLSDDATLSDLTVGDETVTGFAAATTAYNVELPFGTAAVPTVAGTANSTYAKSVVVTPAASLPGSTTVVVTAENNSTKTYTINFTVADSKLINLVWKTGQSACEGAGSQAAVIKSNNAAVSPYIKEITFENVEGSGDDAAEGGSLNTGKKAGNTIIIQTKPGYLFTTMSFYGKIETEDAKCLISIDGGANWSDLASTSGSDATYCNVVSSASTNDIRIKSAGIKGTWIRNMQLTITTGCSPVKLNWTAEPAAEYEVGKAAAAIAATANNGGAVTYSSTASGIVNVAANGALTIAGLGSATLKAATAEGDGTAFCTNGGEDIVISKAVNTYYLVKFDAQNETAVNEVKYHAGDAAIATPVQPSYSGFVFQGWFDAASAGNAVTFPLTPESSRTIYAQWVAECTGPTINVHPASANYLTGRTASALTCEATAGAAGELTYTWYSCDDAERTNPVVLVGAPTPSTAVAGTFYYYCAVTEAGCDIIRNSNVATITIEDKEPVCIIKSIPTSGNDASVDGYYKGSAFFKGSNAKKLSSGYDYVGVQLMADKSFLATDKVVLNQAADLGDASDITKFYVFTETPASGKSYVTVDNPTPQKGDNWFAMPAELVGESSLYIGRVDSKCNPTLGYLAVYRAMNPELIAIAIDERAGVIDPMDDKHFNVTIPYEADLANLTIVDEVVWNAPHATTPKAVISNEGAWIIGDNTYRLMDKDGDYTDYTITLTRDVLKHTVSFNTHGGSAVASVLVEHNGYLTAVPNNPSKEDYIFQYWSLTDGGDEVDITTVQINENKEFHAVWASEGAIKLINGDVVNHTNFLTGTNETTVEIESVDYKCVDFTTAGSNRTTVSSISELKEFIQYNATTNKAKISLSLYNTYSSAVSVYLHMLEEGSEAATTEEISVPAGEIFKTNYYAFNSEKNRSFYITCGNRNYIKVLQVKVVDDGTTTLKKAGQVGYSVNTVKSRIFAPQQSAISFEGLTINANAVCKPLSTTALKIKNNYNISFHADAAMTLAVTTEGNQTYYVSATADGTTNETSFTGRKEFEITAGDWYIHASSELKVAKLEFIAPKCQKPTISAQPQSKQTFGPGSNLTATVVADAPSDGGTLKYQWYKAADDSEVSGATESTLTTTEEGTYYVIVTNTLANHSDNSVKSEEATLGYRVMDDATLSALSASAGTLDPTFDKDVLEYRVDLPEGTVDVPTLSATATMDGYATVNITDATAFVNYEATSTVVVTSEDENANKTYTVKFYVDHQITTLVDVTGNMSWDFSKANDGTAATENLCNDAIFANVAGIVNNNDFESDNLKVTANKFKSGKLQASMIKFHTTVDGMIRVVFSNTGAKTSDRYLTVNGRKTDKGSKNETAVTYTGFVYAGDVELGVVEGDGNMLNFTSVEFVSTVAYPRTVNPNNIGTLCWTNDAVLGGATLYELVGKNEYNKLVFEEVVENRLEAGKPYVFVPENGNTAIKVYNTSDVSADGPVDPDNGMMGTFVDMSSADGTTLYGNYVISNNKYIYVDSDNVTVRAYRAYITSLDDIAPANPEPNSNPNGSPRRRIVMGAQSEQVATGCENLNVSDKPVKVIINGQLFILRGEKMYDAKGQLVK